MEVTPLISMRCARARVESAGSPTPLLLQDLEKYVRERRKKDAERVMRGMQGWEWKGLEAGLAEMGIGMFSVLTAKSIASYTYCFTISVRR